MLCRESQLEVSEYDASIQLWMKSHDNYLPIIKPLNCPLALLILTASFGYKLHLEFSRTMKRVIVKGLDGA